MPSPRTARLAVSGLLVLAVLAGCGEVDAGTRSATADCAAGALPVGTSSQVADAAGEPRRYLVNVPPAGADAEGRRPLVVLLHGLGGSPEKVVDSTRMLDLSNDAGFVLVAPEGLGPVSHWDFRTPAGRPGSDLTFIDDLTATIQASGCIDERRTYVAGFSNGSAMVMALACEDSTRFAAFAGVAAPLDLSRCPESPAAPMIYFHGVRDKVVPFAGADTRIGPLPGVVDSMAGWAAKDRCPASGARTTVTAAVEHFSWTDCRSGADVEVYAFPHGVHQWPGGGRQPPAQQDSGGTTPIDASALIWKFFVDHPRGGA